MTLADELAAAARDGQTFTPGLWKGDANEWLRRIGENKAHAVITDPPYGLSAEPDPVEVLRAWLHEGDFTKTGGGFMSAAWDSFVPGPATWRAIWNVLRPGGHCLVFASTRTVDWMMMSLRLAGFECRDLIMFCYGTGFPKSLDIGKAIDKRGGNSHLTNEIAAAIRAERERKGWTLKQADDHFCRGSTSWHFYEGRSGGCRPPTPADFERIASEWPNLAEYAAMVREADRPVTGSVVHARSGGEDFAKVVGSPPTSRIADITAPATAAAAQWSGFGTSLKPALEPIIVARKPLRGTVARNVQEWGAGGLNIDACRIAGEGWTHHGGARAGRSGDGIMGNPVSRGASESNLLGRWPANLLLSCDCPGGEGEHSEPWCPVLQLDAQSGDRKSNGGRVSDSGLFGGLKAQPDIQTGYGDTGGASRFFYTGKAPRKERPEYVFERSLFTAAELAAFEAQGFEVPADGTRVAHPTVKPLSVMRWLCRLVTPPNGLILDPFMGTGATAEAASAEGLRWSGAERHLPYWPLIEQRVARATKG